MKVFAIACLMLSTLDAHSLAADRYSMMKLSDGTVRIDHNTGAISYCREKEGNMICSLAAEERQAWISETEELSSRIDRLEQRLKILEKPSGEVSKETGTGTKPEENRELDNALDFMEKAIRRFSDVFDDLKSELNSN